MSAYLYVLVVRARRALARPAVRRALVAVLAVATGLTVMSLMQAADAARARWGDTRAVAVATRDLAPGELVDAAAVTVRDLPAGLVSATALASVSPGAVVRHPIVAGEPVVAARLAPDGLTGVAALVPSGLRAVAVPVGPAGGPPLVVGDRVDVIAVLPPGVGASRPPDVAGSDRPSEGDSADRDGDPGDDTDRGGEAGDTGGEAGSTGDSTDLEGDPGDDADSGGETGGTGDRAGDLGEPAFALAENALVVDVADGVVTVAVPRHDAPRVAWALGLGSVVLTLVGG